jgi:hypothetical protein
LRLARFLLYVTGMRLDQALGISVCLLFAGQFACSSSNNGRKVDGAPGDTGAYKDMSGPDSRDGSTDTDRDASNDLAPTGTEVGAEIGKDTAMPDLPPDLPTGGDLPAPPIEAGGDHFVDTDLPAPPIDTGRDTGRDTWIDGQAIDQSPTSPLDGGDGTSTSGESRPNPCASCAANQVCAQLNDGTCSSINGLQVVCRTVSDACRTKLTSSGGKSCSALSECESELCPVPSYRCVYASPCGNEIPEAAVYCYGS